MTYQWTLHYTTQCHGRVTEYASLQMTYQCTLIFTTYHTLWVTYHTHRLLNKHTG